MNQSPLFSNGLELANLLANSDLLYGSWDAILNTPPTTFSVTPFSNGSIISFVVSPISAEQHLQGDGKNLVSSATLKDHYPFFDFISTKVNPSFSIHKAAITLYATLHHHLSSLEIDIYKPLVITGHSLFGSVASLFTLWLLDNVYSKKPKDKRKDQPKPPICITFGSPLLGDDGFQRAIRERPSWHSCFLNVVSTQDPIPRLFVSTSHSSNGYMPFGTFLFCSQFGCACFEEPESVLKVMMAMNSESVGNVTSCDYTGVLDAVGRKAMCRGVSELGEFNFNPLRTGITLQLEAIGILKAQLQQQHSNDMSSLIADVEERLENRLKAQRKSYDATKKLNDIKINMTYMEWYKKVSEGLGGYYDCYKTPKGIDETSRQQGIIKHQRILTMYWKEMVEKANQMPQKEGFNFRTRWLYAGTNYRRMVEPLDIAYYYKQGKRDYINKGRSVHYKLLEEWMEEDKKEAQITKRERSKGCSMTEDSCFWAHVEEAIISCKVLKDREIRPEQKKLSLDSLTEFETYVMDSIKKLSVSKEIFLEKNSYMKWWREYNEIMGISHDTELTDYMRDPLRRYV